MENFHVIVAKYIGQTNRNSSRIQLHSPRFNQRIYIEFDSNSTTDTLGQARQYLQNILFFKVIGQAMGANNSWLIITNTFEPLKKK